MTVERSADPIDFERFCGPTSVAAATGISRARAARVLWGIQRDRGLIVAPYAELEDVVLALDLLGVVAEPFDPITGQLVESATQCLDRARRTSPHRMPTLTAAATEVIEASPADAQPALWEFFNNRHSDKPTLRAWLQRMPGLWLVIVDAPPSAHWIALRDHRVLVDTDQKYFEAPVIRTLRLTAREESPCLPN